MSLPGFFDPWLYVRPGPVERFTTALLDQKRSFPAEGQLFLSTRRLEALAKLWLKTQAPLGNCQLSQPFLLLILTIKN